MEGALLRVTSRFIKNDVVIHRVCGYGEPLVLYDSEKEKFREESKK